MTNGEKVLEALDKGEMSLQALTEATGLAKSIVAPTLSGLKGKGLVVNDAPGAPWRKTGPRSRKKTLVDVAEKHAAGNAFNESFVVPIPEVMLGEVLQKACDDLEAKAKVYDAKAVACRKLIVTIQESAAL